MADLEVKSIQGKVVGKQALPKSIAEAAPLMSVLHRAVVAEEANTRQGTQSALTRSEVRGGGRKPYKQKKTGNARQGTIRAPHYAHGGMAFAVKPRDYEKKINRKERRGAILGALHAQITAENVITVDQLVFAEAKTKHAVEFLKAFGLDTVRRVLIILPTYDEATYRCFRNLPNVVVRTAPAAKGDETKTVAFSTRDILIAHKVVIAQDALTRIEEVWSK